MNGGPQREPARRNGHSRRAWPELLCLALLFMSFLGFVRRHSSDVPGGSDSWGYVSEAVRLSQGHFYEREQVLSPFGLPEDAGRTHPLGYVEKGREGTVPTYPFGYPLLMAGAIKLFGLEAAFWVTPVLAAGALLLTYWLGRAALGRAGGAMAAVLLAVLPNFLWGAFQPLSDVPAAFFCTLTLVALLAMPAGPTADLLLGASLGSGIWVRPNMGLLVGLAGLWLVARGEWRRLARVAMTVAPFLLVEALINAHLFGAPWRTGYGELHLGGPLAETLARGGRHLLRLNDQQAGLGLLLLALALIWNRIPAARRFLLAGVFVAFLGFFAAYRIDDAWWYFRFLVPAMPAVTVLEAGFLMRFTGPGRASRLRAWAVTLAVCAIAVGSFRYTKEKRVFTLAEVERKYPRVAALVSRTMERPALVLAMQHSGSLRFYAGIQSARYDLGSPQELKDTLSQVSRAGGHLYLVAEDWELRQIRGSDRAFLVEGALELGFVEPSHVTLFRLRTPEAPGQGPGAPGSLAANGSPVSGALPGECRHSEHLVALPRKSRPPKVSSRGAKRRGIWVGEHVPPSQIPRPACGRTRDDIFRDLSWSRVCQRHMEILSGSCVRLRAVVRFLASSGQVGAGRHVALLCSESACNDDRQEGVVYENRHVVPTRG